MREETRRNHKDRLFCEIFRDPKRALSLYNAILQRNHDDPADIKVVTLEDALYLRMKNDLAILLQDTLLFVEQQSSVNPNMPLRGLMYAGRTYNDWRIAVGKDLYSSSLIEIPTPAYFVLYNGGVDAPDRQVLRLSDAFQVPGLDLGDGRPPYEWSAIVLNVNLGHNRQLLEACPELGDYALFVDTVRKVHASGAEPRDAISSAVDVVVSGGRALSSYFLRNRSEVVDVFMEEMDIQLHEQALHDKGVEEGIEQGIERGRMSTLIELVRDGTLSLDVAAAKVGLSEEEFESLVTEA